MSHPTNPVPSVPAEPVTVSCVDAVGRTRQLTITASRGRVTLRTPPGEVAILHPAAITQLSDVLRTLTGTPTHPDERRGATGEQARP